MANEFVDILRPRDFVPEGLDQKPYLVQSGDTAGLPLPKNGNIAYNAWSQIPGSLTVGTGLTFTVIVVDDTTNSADLGKVVRVGITVKKLASGTDNLDIDSGAATEATADITLDATSGEFKTGSIAIANAALDSVGAGDLFAIRVRRVSSASQDTCSNRVVLLGVAVKNT